MPWMPNSHASNAASASRTSATTGGRCTQVKPRAIPLTAGSGTRGRRWRSAITGSRLGRSGVLPSCSARTPSGRSLWSARKPTLRALTMRPSRADTSAATASRSRRPSAASAIRKSSRGSWTTWPSARRASSGGFLKPEPSYSPMSSMPSASARTSPSRRSAGGDTAGSAIAMTPGSAAVRGLQELRLEDVRLRVGVGPGDQIVGEHRADAVLLPLDRDVEVGRREVLTHHAPQVPADVPQLEHPLARELHRLLDDADELPRLRHRHAPRALDVERLGDVAGAHGRRRARHEDDLERDRGRAAVRAARERVRGVELVDHVAAVLPRDAPRKVGREPAVRLGDRRRHVVVRRRLRAAGRQRAGEDQQQREGEAAGPAHHEPLPVVVSPWSISDVWSVVAFAMPCSVCTITESCSADASEVEPGDRMFALTAASMGAAMFAFAASAALIGAARSSARSRLTSRFSSEPPDSRSPPLPPPVSAGAGVVSVTSPWLRVESWSDVAFAVPSRACWSNDCCGAVASEVASGESALALTAASIGTAAFALSPTAALIGAARSRSAARSASRSSSELPCSAPSTSVTVLPTSPTVSPTAGSASPTESIVSLTTPPTVPTVSLTAGSVSLTESIVSPTTPPTVSTVSLTAGRTPP